MSLAISYLINHPEARFRRHSNLKDFFITDKGYADSSI